MIEKWKDIKGFEGKYQVSNIGRIKSLNYNNTNQSKLLQPRINKRGIYTVNLWKNNKAHQFSIGLLVAKHFLKQEDETFVVIHLEDRLDDNVKNLKFVSRSEARRRENIRKKNNPKETIVENFDNVEYRKGIQKAKGNGITPHQVYKRLYEGWTFQDAITIPIERKERILNKRLYLYNGKLLSVKQIAEKNGKTTNQIYKRLSRDWNIYEAAEIPIEKRKRRKK